MKTVDSRGVFYALLVLLYGAVFSFTACSNDDDPNDDPNEKRQYVPKFEFTASVTPDLCQQSLLMCSVLKYLTKFLCAKVPLPILYL